jgi:hypothetical protein
MKLNGWFGRAQGTVNTYCVAKYQICVPCSTMRRVGGRIVAGKVSLRGLVALQ